MKKLIALLLAALMLGAAAASAEESAESLQPGDIITLGAFEQDGDTSNGNEPVEWIVLDIDEENQAALVLSRYALYACPYNAAEAAVTWENSAIRSLLNDYLVYMMFSEDELELICIAQLENPDRVYDSYSVPGGDETEDALFLLSAEEAELYLPDAASRVCIPTELAVISGAWTVTERMVSDRPFAYTEDMIGCCSWWLRGPGANDQSPSSTQTDPSLCTVLTRSTAAAASAPPCGSRFKRRMTHHEKTSFSSRAGSCSCHAGGSRHLRFRGSGKRIRCGAD